MQLLLAIPLAVLAALASGTSPAPHAGWSTPPGCFIARGCPGARNVAICYAGLQTAAATPNANVRTAPCPSLHARYHLATPPSAKEPRCAERCHRTRDCLVLRGKCVILSRATSP